MSRDLLREFIDDYNAGRIDVSQLQGRLDFEAWREDEAAAGREVPAADPADYARRAFDPPGIIVSAEETWEKMYTLALLRDAVYYIDWIIITLIARGKNPDEIAEDIGASRETVTRRLAEIAVKAGALGLREVLTPTPKEYEARAPKDKIAYPMDFFKNHAEPGRDGRMVTRCRVPEYLAECGCESVCTYCDKCTRKQG